MWSDYLNTILNIPDDRSPLVLDLFAGCGGLSLGFEAAGFDTIGFEKDLDAARSYQKNLKGRCVNIKLEIGCELPLASVIIGGPPCQPFSVRGAPIHATCAWINQLGR